MRLFLRISLFLSSLLLVCCSPVTGYKYQKTQVVSRFDAIPVINLNRPLLFKTKIDIFNQHLSGLLLIKYTGENATHLTFVTEIGMKMFDFEIKDSVLKPVYVFEPLNKPKFIKLLQNDLGLIVFYKLTNKKADIYDNTSHRIFRVKEGFRYYYKMDRSNGLIEKALKRGSLFTKVKVDYTFDKTNNDPEKIILKHKGLVRLRIEMVKLNKEQI